jgi:purine catabolism regulator
VWLVAVRRDGSVSAHDLLLLRHAAPLAALELLRQRFAREQERARAAQALEEILSGKLSGEEVEHTLAGRGLRGEVAAIVVSQPDDPRFSPERLATQLAIALRREAAAALSAPNGPFAVALIPGLPGEQLFELAGRVGVGLQSGGGPDLRIGVGRAGPASDAGKSFEEARFALEAQAMRSRRSAQHPQDDTSTAVQVATYRDLGSIQLLLALQESDALSRFCDSILGPIEAMESSYGGELLRSLQVFIEANGNWERAARQLFCHRHTLRYRIRKIEELTGRDLEAATDRMEFYLALHARALLS